MPVFNLNKLRSYGLRYIVADKSGQLWAFEAPPVRSSQYDGYWVLCDEHKPPKSLAGSRAYFAYTLKAGRRLAMPLLDCPFSISWDDDPFDLIEQGIVTEKDMRCWGEFPKF